MNKPHPHAALMADFANDAALMETPWENWEYFDPGGGWTSCPRPPAWCPTIRYRRKPRTIRAEEHLDLILTFCRSQLVLIGSLNSSASRAGWRATIAAIEQYNRFCGLLDFDTMQPLADAILAAYPLELLQPTT
jgi:hypothetical protein